jgi:hypothetical protein
MSAINSLVCWRSQGVSGTREVSGTEDAALFLTLKCVVKRTSYDFVDFFMASRIIGFSDWRPPSWLTISSGYSRMKIKTSGR